MHASGLGKASIIPGLSVSFVIQRLEAASFMSHVEVNSDSKKQ